MELVILAMALWIPSLEMPVDFWEGVSDSNRILILRTVEDFYKKKFNCKKTEVAEVRVLNERKPTVLIMIHCFTEKA